ncbi:TPM domain-containing protein [Pseudomonas viridiflava]|uniref:TPM domain-containing protein n=1 Tax=Pseudomonas syringae group TaxID=136849 RepID=UPI0013CE4CA0|nr:TPM domain-containing protein [Pseudomonas viridiflava]
MLYAVMTLGVAFRAQADQPVLVFPPMTGSVVDAAQMLDSQTTVRLAKLLRAYEQATGERIVVVTLADLQGATIEEFGAQLGDAWDLGRGGKANSALLVVDREKRKVLMEVGSGLEDRLSDAQSSLIINMLVTPEFNDSRFAIGIERGAQAMIAALGGQVPDYPEPAARLAVYEEPLSDFRVWLTAIVLTLVVLLIVFVSIRRSVGRLCPGEQSAGRCGGRFDGGGASGNW